MGETDFVKALMMALPLALPVRLWRQNAGQWQTSVGNVIHGAPKGAADVSGIVLGPGWRLEIEAKVGVRKQTPEQKQWERRIVEWGGIYVLVRDDGRSNTVGRAVELVRRAIVARTGAGTVMPKLAA